jgi:hypothetical protein
MSSKMEGKDRWELYDLDADPGERVDLADQYPDKIKELSAFWEQYCIETGTVWGPERYPGEYEHISYGRVPPGSLGGDPIEDAKGWMKDTAFQGSKLKENELSAVASASV